VGAAQPCTLPSRVKSHDAAFPAFAPSPRSRKHKNNRRYAEHKPLSPDETTKIVFPTPSPWKDRPQVRARAPPFLLYLLGARSLFLE
jgi:hypothetical protein